MADDPSTHHEREDPDARASRADTQQIMEKLVAATQKELTRTPSAFLQALSGGARARRRRDGS